MLPTRNIFPFTFQTFSPMAYFPPLKSLLTKAVQYYFPPLPSYPLMDEEAFPDADELFRKAFGLSDPTPGELLT